MTSTRCGEPDSTGSTRKRRACVILGCALLAPAIATPPAGSDRADALPQLVASERAFSAMSVEKGMRDAFVEFLADDAIIFRPLPVNGKSIWQARKPSPATLIWEPSRAEISAAGDLGWTTGPWEFRPPPDSTGAPPRPEDIAHGHFTSVWTQQKDGTWRVAIDIGVSHDKPARGVGSGDLVNMPAHSWIRSASTSKPATDLQTLDARFASDLRSKGSKALATWAGHDVRWNREGAMPTTGMEAAKSACDHDAPLVALHVVGTRVSASDDLGYTYGIAERASKGSAPDSSGYMHVWRKEFDRKWRLAATVENPVRHP